MSRITQTTALFLDAYRDLNAKRMFWVTLIISLACILGFALIGMDAGGLYFLKSDWRFADHNPQLFYKAFLLKAVMVDFWLTWAATILALISTAGIFPDFLAGGSVDLYLSKPIGRPRLFFTKFLCGLLFATLQVAVFSVGMFVIVGLRAHQWIPSLLLAVPIVVCFYSYLYAVCVLLGVTSRSTVTAILLTLLVWLLLWGVQKTDVTLLQFQYAQQYRAERFGHRAEEAQQEIDRLKAEPSVINAFGVRTASLRADREKYLRLQRAAEDARAALAKAHGVVYALATVLPKTGPTIDLLDRHLIRDREAEIMVGGDEDEPPPAMATSGGSEETVMNDYMALAAGARKAIRETRHRSTAWVLGTSLGFEAVALLLAGWVFCRRDY